MTDKYQEWLNIIAQRDALYLLLALLGLGVVSAWELGRLLRPHWLMNGVQRVQLVAGPLLLLLTLVLSWMGNKP